MNGAYRYDDRQMRTGLTGPGPANNWSAGVGRGGNAPGPVYGGPVQSTGTRPGGPVGQGYGSDRVDIKQALGYNDSSGVYEMDHLATFTLPPNQAKLTPADAVRKLYDLDATRPSTNPSGSGGVWTMRVYLCVEPQCILVVDATSHEEMERFPMSQISEPACVTPRGGGPSSSKFTNIVLFTVLEDPGKGSPTEMHLFQCLGGPGQKVVDDIIASMAGNRSTPVSREPQPVISQHKYSSPAAPSYGTPASRLSQDSLYKDFGLSPEVNAQVAMNYKPDPVPRQRFRQSIRYPEGGPSPQAYSGTPSRHESESSRSQAADSTETMERCINLLDHCFSDIESFVGKLQQAAVAYNELDRRKTVRGNKNSKQIGDGLLGMRSRPPAAKDFVDILQKFKLSFILLAKLKGHIRDPNSPELVHFLFNPLGLVVETSRAGTSGGAPDLSSRVVSPLLTHDARDLLDNCLTTKETELWRSLGPAWTTSSDRWEGEMLPYMPQFYDGWQPPNFWLEDIGVASAGAVPSTAYQAAPTVPQSLYGRFAEPTGSQSSYQTDYSSPSPLSQSFTSAYSGASTGSNGNQIYGSPLQQQQQHIQQQEAVVVEDKTKQKKGWGLFGSKSSKSAPSEASSVVSNNNKTKEDKPKVMDKSKKPPAPTPAAKPVNSGIYGMAPVGIGAPSGTGGPSGVGGPNAMGGAYNQSTQEEFAKHLISIGAKAYRVIQDRNASNTKELSVKEGDIVEVLDDSRNWWSVRNPSNESGFVPKTLLERL